MERRKFMLGVGSLAAGSAATIGTGAFNEVQADRTVSIETASDADAYLKFVDQSHYAQMTGTPGTIQLNFDSSNQTGEGGTGLNANATTQFLHLFDIENQGTQTVGIQIDTDALNAALDAQSSNGDPQFHFFVGEHGGSTLDGYDKSDMRSTLPYNNPSADPRVLKPGETLKVGCYIVSHDGNWDVEETVTVNALTKSNAAAVSN
ncbi:hypothetical protein [Natrinema salsiterrestre]|uniref:DUF1102 domain-containing protein n=1 Tax=Natrinema salsiterrestre TaxID=2950540 RepID=A0A9Q4L141_9EURY|nr:hypothetical protein [Natrinema salsiterrestre]MDF9745687.1 hypothetical protein [Natrinema salsiterrestre]